MEISDLTLICERNGLLITNEEANTLAHYAKFLSEWNAKINLISRKDEGHILDRHILHSLTLRMPGICEYDFTNKRIADLGTGGGLPGIPLKIVTPSMDMTLIDSIQKKITACSEMISELGLPNIRAMRGRVEEIAHLPEHRNVYDAIVSRAVAPLDDLVNWSRGLLKPNGMLFALKGGDLEDEIGRTKKMKFVKNVEVVSLALNGYDEFLQDEKKLVSVSF